MGWTLIAAVDPSWIDMPLNILKVAIGLGLVIFVHELGHFLVAKLCGVKCEKFYLGFDIAGWKLAKFTWGETEYGIGVLPLGGYVKMLGQEDNPARLREEIERAKAAAASSANPATPKDASPDSPPPSAAELQMAEQALFDPRSYLAKSVPQRMAIISAGVVMNVLFAFIFAIGGYRIGVEKIAPVVGAVAPGEGAWQAGVEVGDRILEIANHPIRDFERLRMAVSLGDNPQGVPLVMERPGKKEPLHLLAKTAETGLAPSVGIGSSSALTLRSELPFLPETPAAQAQPSLKGGDRIVAINGTPVERFAELYDYLAAHPDETLQLSIERPAMPSDPVQGVPKRKELTVQIAPAPWRSVGLVLQMGPIVAIQNGSPAAEAHLQPGDVILQLNGEPVGDPMTLPERLHRLSLTQKSAQLKIQRQPQAEPLELEVDLRDTATYDNLVKEESPLTASALGIAYRVHGQVAEVLPGNPAAEAGLQPGMVIDQARLHFPDPKWLQEHGLEKVAEQLQASPPSNDWMTVGKSWPHLMNYLQDGLPGVKIDVRTPAGEKTLTPVPVPGRFYPGRGFVLEPEQFTLRAGDLSEAVRLGGEETWSSVTMVFRTVQRLIGRQVSPKALSGPLGIAQVAYYSAAQGMGELLLFLTMLSANLAVINFLPIPVLDGGHMVFLTYEGITGKPPSERVQLALSYLGLLLLLTLMIWALGLDLHLISRK